MDHGFFKKIKHSMRLAHFTTSEQASKPPSKRTPPFLSWWQARGHAPVIPCWKKCVDSPAASPWRLVRNAKSQAPRRTSWIKICLISNSYVISVHIKVWETCHPLSLPPSLTFRLDSAKLLFLSDDSPLGSQLTL